MEPPSSTTQRLVSLPPAMAALFEVLEHRPRPQWFAAGDPPGQKLGSGGGTAHLLVEAWRATGRGAAFADWLRASRKLIIHGAGESHRLPAVAGICHLSAHWRAKWRDNNTVERAENHNRNHTNRTGEIYGRQSLKR